MEIPDDIKERLTYVAERAREDLDPLCEKHLDQLDFHPTDNEFSDTTIYEEYRKILIEFAERKEGACWIELSRDEKSQYKEELKSQFNAVYYAPVSKTECIQCLDEGETDIRVGEPDKINPENVLGKSRSGHGWR